MLKGKVDLHSPMLSKLVECPTGACDRYGGGIHMLTRRVPCSPTSGQVWRYFPGIKFFHLIESNDVAETLQHVLTMQTISR